MLLPTSLIVDFPRSTLAKASLDPSGKRTVYFEATREGVIDREGEEVAADGLWQSRELMLSQGDFDISHFSHLPNPQTGRPQPEYRIGHPTQVTRQGKSIFVAGDIYQSGEGVSAPTQGDHPFWPDYFWHSIAQQNPPAKWFPSVYGKINPGGIEVVMVKGQQVRRITSVQWYSVGFALRAQHPALGPVSLTPVGNLMAKADLNQPDTLHLPWGAFAKSVSEVGQIVTDHAALTGVQALTRQSLDGAVRKQVAGGQGRAQLRLKALRAIHAHILEAKKSALTNFFRREGLGAGEAEELTAELLKAIKDRSQ